MFMKNIIVGTAGWRMPYGNSPTILSEDKIWSLIKFLKKNNINHLDTASSYADAEKIIFNLTDSTFKIDTKIQTFSDKEEFKLLLDEKCDLNINTLYFHDPDIFKRFDSSSIKMFVSQINDCGYKAGFSLYDQSLFDCIDFFNSKNTLQDPVHLLDLTFVKNVIEMKCIPENTYLRSFFARGLFFMEDKYIKDVLGKNYNEVKRNFENQYNANFSSKNLLALTHSMIGYLLKQGYGCVLGMNSSSEVKNLLRKIKLSQFDDFKWESTIMNAKKIIDIQQINL